MRILHISRTMGHGGAEKIVLQLCLDNRQDTQLVASCGGEFVGKLEEAGIKHVQIPDIDSKNPAQMLKTLFILWRTVRKEKIQIIHSHHRMAAMYGRLVSALTGVKTVYTAHSVFFDKAGLTRFALAGSAVVAVGDGVRHNLTDFFGIGESEITTIYNSIKIVLTGVGDPRIEALKGEGKIIVGTIGRIVKQKGMDVFIKAIDICRHRNPNLVGVIVGDGEERVAMETLSNQLGAQNHIVFLGFKNNILDIIRQLDFAVSASQREGLPLTPIEVFSQGKTMIATDISGSNEIVQDGVNGILVEKDNVGQLAEKILALCSDRVFMKELEKHAYEAYAEKYDYKLFLDKYRELYERQLADR